MNKISPYQVCPQINTKNFTMRLVKEEDVKDLLEVYSDKETIKIVNRDNCPIDFYFEEEELLKLIKFWLYEYSYGGYVRFSILSNKSHQVLGTIEIFKKEKKHDCYGYIGLLRLDLKSSYENQDNLDELFQGILEYFPSYFEIDSIQTKANPFAVERLKVLKKLNFLLTSDQNITSYDHYYMGAIQ